MSPLDNVTLADLARSVRRYQPYLAVVAAVLLLVVFLPGEAAEQQAGANGQVLTGGTTAGGATESSTVSGGAGADTVDGTAVGGGDGAAVGGGDGGAGGEAASGAGGPGGTGAGPLPVPAEVGADCDPATGRIRVPTVFAPPCVAPFSGDNGESTAQGVTVDTIELVYYLPRSNPAVDAALTAAGANNTLSDNAATASDYVDYFNATYELYGRQIEFTYFAGSGQSDDDAAMKADAIEIATNIRPFAVVGNTAGNAFVDELAARGVLCVCTTSQPQEYYESRAPYAGYTTLMSSTQGYVQRAEYIGRRLAGRPAAHAGDPLLATQPRTFGILYFETADNAYKSGVDFFERELARYGVSLRVRLAYTGPPDLAATQQQARPFIQRLKEEGVTSVIFAGDPIAPAIFTQEATRQAYNPEWIITGSALTDTTLFARTYDQTQWDNAFGLSFLTARYPREQADAYLLHAWFHGRPPTADNQYAVIYAPLFSFATGLHLAGPNLTVESWQQGLFRYPVTGAGSVTAQTVSFGDHGIWPFLDYTAYDDVTEIWWDPGAVGEDEVGNRGVGMYRYVDGGRRYLPGQHPSAPPRVFDPEGSPAFYDQRPEAERPPDYPPPGG